MDQYQPEQPSQFMKSINEFVNSKNDPNSILSKAMNSSPHHANEIKKQLQTFTEDMKNLEKGTMSYSEMRARYG
jgi:phage shock protein A